MHIIKTKDGSDTVQSEQFGETYHSTFGAITESQHVFMEAGLKQINKPEVHIFEMGFGTGLNTLLSFQMAIQNKIRMVYHTLELYPIPWNTLEKIDLAPAWKPVFEQIHQVNWNIEFSLDDYFSLKKIHYNFLDWSPEMHYDVVFYDAFSPETQPELWTPEIFSKIASMMNSGGILTTYCAKGYVRRNMIAAGFKAERLPGPPGKREMLRGTRI